jgi:hypothetical protein
VFFRIQTNVIVTIDLVTRVFRRVLVREVGERQDSVASKTFLVICSDLEMSLAVRVQEVAGVLLNEERIFAMTSRSHLKMPRMG